MQSEATPPWATSLYRQASLLCRGYKMQTEPCQLLQTDSRRDSNDGRGLTAKAGLSACEATIRASEQEQGVHRYKQDNAESLREAFCILSEYSTKNNMIVTTRREEKRGEEKSIARCSATSSNRRCRLVPCTAPSAFRIGYPLQLTASF